MATSAPPLPHYDTVVVTGPDAASYLQSQLSQQIESLADEEQTYAFLLEPNGKVAGWMRVARVRHDHFELTVDGGAGANVQERLERFKLRTKVSFAVVDGPAAIPTWQRIRDGIPAVGSEITGRTIPAELGPAIIDASVSFTKGCYTGQELVARVDSRGNNVPKPVRALAFAGDVVPAIGAVIDVAGDAVGVVTSAASDPDGNVIGLGLVGRAVAVPATVTVAWDGGATEAVATELVTKLPAGQ